MYNKKTAVIPMARPKKYNIHLTETELNKLKSVIRNKKLPKLSAADARSFSI